MSHKTLTIPNRITADMFGTSAKIFQQHIKGKALQKTGVYGKYTHVCAWVDGWPETFTIHEDDLEPDEKLAERKEIARAKRAKLAANINE